VLHKAYKEPHQTDLEQGWPACLGSIKIEATPLW